MERHCNKKLGRPKDRQASSHVSVHDKTMSGGDLVSSKESICRKKQRPIDSKLLVSLEHQTLQHRKSIKVQAKRLLDNTCHAVRLSDEVLLSIFSYLGPGDLVCCARVCHHWQQISNDNVLWRKQYEKLNRDLLKKQVDNIVADRPTLYWKQLCLTESCKFRDSHVFSEQKMYDPFTYLGKQTCGRLRDCGVKIALDMVDGRGSHHNLRSNHIFYHRVGLTARWDNSFPPIESIKKIRLLALKPVFFERRAKEWGAASPNSPCQRSLLRVYEDFSAAKLSQTRYVSDSMVNHHFYDSGILIGTFHNEGGFAYICVNIPLNGILERCFHGTNLQPYEGTFAIGRFSSMPLLQGYGATLVIRHHREEIWSNQWRCGDITVSQTDGHTNLRLIEGEKPHQHQKVNKSLQTLYVAGSFKNKCKELCIMELILMNGNYLAWTFSENVPISTAKSEDFSYLYSDNQLLSIQHCSGDSRGVTLLLSKESGSEYSIIDISITLG